MKHFAVIENDLVINTVVAEDLDTVLASTGKLCVEYTSENPAVIGLPYIDGIFSQTPDPEFTLEPNPDLP
jgi:hypothetical protein